MNEECIAQIEALQRKLSNECALAEASLVAISTALAEIGMPLGIDVSPIENIARLSERLS
ncbi:Hypothetical protein, putative [Bodo saltans]|uniref:Uncharacterized protein n=1 Tax=Bodo saltans TaxID=75058 RepID=A0A0S4KI20_BODSA|nr:Hypothetical protein, putative [Bodo saltans]|eukprot:CUI15329.1 Hypothetical protein, putative [Bodo saltans]